MQQEGPHKHCFTGGLLIVLGLTWGSSYILMKKGLKVFSAQEVGALRIFFAAVFLLPLSLPRLRQLQWQHYKRLLLVGFLGSLLPAFLFAQAQTQLDSALNGVLTSLSPIFALLLGRLCFQQPIAKNEILGALLGLIGTLLLVFADTEHCMGKVNYYALLPLLGCFCYGLNSNLVKYYLQDLSTNTITSVSFLLIGIMTAVMLFTQTAFLTKLRTVEGAYFATGYVLILGALGSAIAYLLFVKLVKCTSPVFASMVSFIIPLVALGWGLLDGEELIGGQYLGIGAILSGVYLVKNPSRS